MVLFLVCPSLSGFLPCIPGLLVLSSIFKISFLLQCSVSFLSVSNLPLSSFLKVSCDPA
jgi:hypothetical protein